MLELKVEHMSGLERGWYLARWGRTLAYGLMSMRFRSGGFYSMLLEYTLTN